MNAPNSWENMCPQCRDEEGRKERIEVGIGVPVVAQWLTNPTRNHKVAGSIPGLAQWVKVLTEYRIGRCRELCRLQTQLGSHVAVAVV